MNALVLAFAHKFGFLGKRKSPLHAFGLLWVGDELAQPQRAPSAVVAVAHNQRGKLQFTGIGRSLEQLGHVGRRCGQRRVARQSVVLLCEGH